MPELLVTHLTLYWVNYIYDAYHIGGQCLRHVLWLRFVSGSG